MRVRVGVWALALGASIAAACNVGESGIAPPVDRFFFPTGLAVDGTGRWLYVVNSNSNLRYNTGTVVTVDLAKAAADRDATASQWQGCPSPTYVAGPRDPACCRDAIDPRVLNCREAPYLTERGAVRIGSFGGAAVLQEAGLSGPARPRLFVAVRGDPSVTFVDVDMSADGVSLRCGDQSSEATREICGEESRIRDGTVRGRDVDILEEPFALTLDAARQILYVGHLSTPPPTTELGGVSAIDVCGAGEPRLASVSRLIFSSVTNQSVTSLTLDPSTPGLFATSRVTSEIGGLVLRDAGAAACEGGGPRDLELVPRSSFFSAAFALGTAELRGMVLSPDGRKAFVLHRNVGRESPPAVAVIDREPDPGTGRPVNQPVGVVEVCPGATELKLHDVGEGRGARLFVPCFESGQIYVVDPDRLAVTAVVDVGRGPNTMVFPGPASQIAYVSGFADNNVSVVDLMPGSETEYRVVQRVGFPRPRGTHSTP